MKPFQELSRRGSRPSSRPDERRLSSSDKRRVSSSSSSSSFDMSLCSRRESQSSQPNVDFRHEMDRQLSYPHDLNNQPPELSNVGATAQSYAISNDKVGGVGNSDPHRTRSKSAFNFRHSSASKSYEPLDIAGHSTRQKVVTPHLSDVNHSAAIGPKLLTLTQNQCDNHSLASSYISPSVISPDLYNNGSPSLLLNVHTLNIFPDTKQEDGLHEKPKYNSNGGDSNSKEHSLTGEARQSSHLNHPQQAQILDNYSHDGRKHLVCSKPPESETFSSPASLDHEYHGDTSLLPVSMDDGPASAPLLSPTGCEPNVYQKKSNTTKPTQSATLHYLSQPNISSRAKGSGMRQQKSSSDLESLKHAFEHKLEPDNMKTKLLSVWNNIKYGWTFKGKANFKLDTPIFLLGESYHKSSEDNGCTEHEFMKDFASRIWFTYRSNFYPIPGSKFKTDCGWGCMLRSGQMLTAQCLLTHYLGRNWRMYNQQTRTQLTFYREIIRWFSDPIDSPSDHFPLSLHHLVQFGRKYNKSPGDWYGPASVAYILRDALNRAGVSLPVLGQLGVYVAQDCTVYIEDVKKLCLSRGKTDSFNESVGHEQELNARSQRHQTLGGSSGPWQRALIMLIPVRLGGEVMNEVYSPCIQNLLSYRQCMGIIGGKPKHSLYFIGWQDDKLIYLDPHYCRDAIDIRASNFPTESYHCMSPRKMPINRMDPSCTIGFYIRNAEEFEQFVQEVQEYISPPNQRGSYPLFIFTRGSHEDASQAHERIGVERGRVRVRHYRLDQNGERQPETVHESEDFVML